MRLRSVRLLVMPTHCPLMGLGGLVIRVARSGESTARAADAERCYGISRAGRCRFYSIVKDPGRGERLMGEEPRAQKCPLRIRRRGLLGRP
jgi:hypothetical protein